MAVQRFSRWESLLAAILARDQEGFLCCGFREFVDFGFRCGFDGAKIQAGGSLAGNDSSEASWTGSTFCETSARSRASRSSDLGDEDSRFSAGLAMPSYFTSVARRA
jgi:hypothetical protein